jgi:hypothetical protein
MEAPATEYLRVDEIAHRFGVSVDDVIAACSVLGFPVHDVDGLVSLDLFTQALKAAAPHLVAPQVKRRSAFVTMLGAAAALLLVVAGVGLVSRDSGPSASERAASARAAAAYRAQIKQTYDAAVAAAPESADYQTLAKELQHITPPPAYQAAHAQLVNEAQTVAELTNDQLTSVVDTTSAANALREHVDEIETSTRVGK